MDEHAKRHKNPVNHQRYGLMKGGRTIHIMLPDRCGFDTTSYCANALAVTFEDIKIIHPEGHDAWHFCRKCILILNDGLKPKEQREYDHPELEQV